MALEKRLVPPCDSLIQQADRWFTILRKYGVDVLPSAESYFDRCPICRSGKPKKGTCQGGSLRIDTNNPIRFASGQNGHSVVVTVTAETHWDSAFLPFPKKHSVEVEVSTGGKSKNRAHLDLAVNSRREPLFHLQAGGFRIEKISGGQSLGLLRWPMIPLDVVLVTELVLYTFQPDDWEAAHQNSEFLYAVRQSEERFLSPFFENFKLEGRGQSFLSAFCASRQSRSQDMDIGSRPKKRV